ncbi:MAG: Uncharacterized protein G01um101438_365 [Parcubacteria group bacterium Gr01-1014_38]|nr:MAG: Uncharacterized protein G01um101438_365 [Parcubacteria group bacterium Gr01-1014_38]
MLPENVLNEILVTPGYVTAADFGHAADYARKYRLPIEEVIVSLGILEEAALGQIIADYYQVPYVNLRGRQMDKTIVRLVPEALARKQQLILYDRDAERGYVAILNPADRETVNILEKHLGFPIKPTYASPSAIAEALRVYQKGLHEEFELLIRGHVSEAAGRKQAGRTGLLAAEEVSIVRIVETIIKYAYQSRASDIHMEPTEREVAVRFRIDGVLGDVVAIPKDIYELVVMRVKVLAQLRTDEHLAAQDGKFRFDVVEEDLDIRVSIVPVVHGEKIVLRLLSQKLRRFTLEDLGMQKDDLQKVRVGFLRPHGMIFSTGPTGCGKTTTLYVILKILNTREVNIATIEDPVEYYIEGVNHIQVNPRTNLTFATGLRSIVRQDPDIIMVGEVRDQETASISINAALTGHLVLSTLHTNDAPTTLPRLLDMGVEPFLLASSVNVVIGQRLVRRICRDCLVSRELSDQERDVLLRQLHATSAVRAEVESRPRVYGGQGCARCNGLGYLGRIGIFEVIAIDDEIRPLIMRKASAAELRERAIARGMTTMLEDGVRKVFQGVTTLEELLLAVQE